MAQHGSSSSSSSSSGAELDGAVVALDNQQLRALPDALRSAGASPALRDLNLAFNELTSLAGLADACPQLVRLSAAHNRLRSLPPLDGLGALHRLDLSSNLLRDVSALAVCVSLRELWLASNCLELSAVPPLQPLSQLSHLVLHGNPCLKLQPSGLGPHAVAALLPQLASLDAQPLSAASRADAAAFLSTQVRWHSSPNDLLMTS